MSYITREAAVATLYRVINSSILDSALEDALVEIASCIEHEGDNLFLWGAEDEVTDLFAAPLQPTPDWYRHCDALYEKYKIRAVRA